MHLHRHLRTVIVAPMTTGSRPAAFRIPVVFGGKKGLVLLDQICTIDKQRLVQKKALCLMPPACTCCAPCS